jgi:hypothetical protein
MRKALCYIFLVIALFPVLSGGSQAKELILNNAPAQVYFSPQGGCTDAIVAELDTAKNEILVQA